MDTIFFLSTEKRFAWFSGIVPHTTVFERTEVPSTIERIHHSSYMKMRHEQMALVALDKRYLSNIVLLDQNANE